MVAGANLLAEIAKVLIQASFFWLGREQQWIALTSPGIRSVTCFGFRYILRVDSDDTRTAPVSGHHHSESLVLTHVKFRPQNHGDELAGREIIINQNDLMQTGPFDLYLILDLGLSDGVSHGLSTFIGGSCARAV